MSKIGFLATMEIRPPTRESPEHCRDVYRAKASGNPKAGSEEELSRGVRL